MKFYTYILYNSDIDKFYIGYTSDITSRLREHNKPVHSSKYTRKQSGDWVLKYYEEFTTKTEAIKREREIKSWKSKVRIRELIDSVEQSR